MQKSYCDRCGGDMDVRSTPANVLPTMQHKNKKLSVTCRFILEGVGTADVCESCIQEFRETMWGWFR